MSHLLRDQKYNPFTSKFAVALSVTAALLASSASDAQTRKPGAAFWGAGRQVQCETFRAWSGQEQSGPVSQAIGNLSPPVAFPRAIDRFHGKRFSDYFGKSYSELTKKEKKKLASLIKSCATQGNHMMGISVAFDTSSSRWIKQYREPMNASIASVNSPQFFAYVRSYERDIDRARIEREQFSGKHFAYDDGVLFHEDSMVRLYWPRTYKSVYGDPCIQPKGLEIVLKRGRDFLVTREVAAQILSQNVIPAIRKACPNGTDGYFNKKFQIAGVYLDNFGKETTRERVRAGQPTRPLLLVTNSLSRNCCTASNLEYIYSAQPDVSDRPPYRYSEYVSQVGSVNAAQRFIARGRLTPAQFAETERRAALAKVNPPWPDKWRDQDAYIEKGNFKGLNHYEGFAPFGPAAFYFDAYSSICSANHKGKTVPIEAIAQRQTGRNTTYLPIAGMRILQTQLEYGEERIVFATVRADQYEHAKKIIRNWRPSEWPQLRAYASGTPQAKKQRQRVQELGCDTPKMRSYERNLFAFIDRVAQLAEQKRRR